MNDRHWWCPTCKRETSQPSMHRHVYCKGLRPGTVSRGHKARKMVEIPARTA